MDRLIAWRDRGAEVLELSPGDDGTLNVQSVLTELGRLGMTNILVEGGADTLGRFRDAGEIDEIHAFVAPKLFGGTQALSPIGGLGVAGMNEAWSLADWDVERVGDDLLIHGLGQPTAR
jgi:diaminohydroxyphosphoribosylaminopyrimidine deaminase/5-amino-6-(5-phosphoribosylamino)uracil reductase